MALLYGRTGRLAAKNGDFRPGQFPIFQRLRELLGPAQYLLFEGCQHGVWAKVRETPSWPRSWANFSLL